MPQLLEALVTLELDSGHRTFSVTGLRGEQFYDQRVISISSIHREISLVPDDFRTGEVTVELNNADNYFSRLRLDNHILHRNLVIRLGDTLQGQQDFRTVFQGEITSWGSTGNIFTVTAADHFHTRFEETVTPSRVLAVQQFPDAPDQSLGLLAPLVIGTMDTSQGNGGGALRAIKVSQTKYVVMQEAVAQPETAIINVYHDGVLVADPPPNAREVIGGQPYRVINYPAPPQAQEITVDVRGLADQNGRHTDQPIALLRRFLLLNGFSQENFDTVKMDQVEIDLAVIGVRIVIWVTDRQERIRDVLDKFTRSTNVSIFLNKDGKISVVAPNPATQVADINVTIDEQSIVKDSFSIGRAEQLASSADYSFRYVPRIGQYDSRQSYRSGSQVQAFGRDIHIPIDLPYQFHLSSAHRTVQDKLFFMQESRIKMQCQAAGTYYNLLNIGDDIRVTHFAGLGQTGFKNKVFRAIGVALQLEAAGPILANLVLVDITETAFRTTNFWRKYWRRPSRIRRNGDASDTP